MRELRDSLIPWLPVIPANWSEVRLKDIGGARNGLTYKPDDLTDEKNGTIVLRSSNIQNSKLAFNDNVFVNSFPEELRVLKDDIIICSRNGSVSLVGKCALIEEDINATFGAFMMRFRTTQHPKFSFYLLQATISAYKSRFGTTTVNQLTNSVFGNMLTVLPPRSEQEAIAAYLDKECEKIGREIELLERKADAYSRLRRSLINRAVTRGLNPNAPLKPSGNDWIGDIPEHWGFERVEKHFHSNTLYNKDFEFTRAFKFFMGTIVPKEEDRDAEEYREVYEKYTIVEENDIMINGLNLNYDLKSMRVGIVPYKGIITSAYVVLRPYVGVNAQFFNYLFKALDYRKFFHGMGKGVRLTLSFNELRTFELPIPTENEQRGIVAYLDEKCGKIDAIIEKIGSKVERLKELKRSLINEVVTGKRAINNI